MNYCVFECTKSARHFMVYTNPFVRESLYSFGHGNYGVRIFS